MLRASFASFPFSSSSFRNNHPRWKSPRYPLGNSTNTPNGLSSSSSSSNEILIDSPGWSAGYGTGGKIWLSSKVLAEYLLKQEEEGGGGRGVLQHQYEERFRTRMWDGIRRHFRGKVLRGERNENEQFNADGWRHGGSFTFVRGEREAKWHRECFSV